MSGKTQKTKKHRLSCGCCYDQKLPTGIRQEQKALNTNNIQKEYDFDWSYSYYHELDECDCISCRTGYPFVENPTEKEWKKYQEVQERKRKARNIRLMIKLLLDPYGLGDG